MKIVIFGLTLGLSWGAGHAPLWRGFCRAFAERGGPLVLIERNVSDAGVIVSATR